jgi:hypothetical protein
LHDLYCCCIYELTLLSLLLLLLLLLMQGNVPARLPGCVHPAGHA